MRRFHDRIKVCHGGKRDRGRRSQASVTESWQSLTAVSLTV
jgi:hypothetical protein